MLTFHEDGDLKGPNDFLNYWNGDKWERAYQHIRYCQEAKEELERLLDDLRALVQMHSDLLHNPGRTANNLYPDVQSAYWDLYYPWYSTERPRALRELKVSLGKFWRGGAGNRFRDEYPVDIEELEPGSLEQNAWSILKGQYDILVAYRGELARHKTDMKIRAILNPTGRGARILSITEEPRVPVILRNR